MTLWVNCFAHFLVDGVCAAAIFGALGQDMDLMLAALIYNTLAFSTQGLVGLLTDRLRRQEYVTALSCVAVILGYALPLPGLLRVILIGAGNSVFHVGGGTMTLLESDGKAYKLGLFVAPGCLGLTLGTLYPWMGAVFSAALFVCAVLLVTYARPDPRMYERAMESTRLTRTSMWIPVLLLVAVAVRAVGGVAVSFPWKTTAGLGIVMTAFVFLGKALGGYACDRFGAKWTAIITVPLAAVLIAFGSQWMIPSLLGQLFLNLTMPVTLYLIYRALPDQPGFAFGLAASALWPGTIAGNLLQLTGPLLWACVLACFGMSMVSILVAYRKLNSQPNHTF